MIEHQPSGENDPFSPITEEEVVTFQAELDLIDVVSAQARDETIRRVASDAIAHVKLVEARALNITDMQVESLKNLFGVGGSTPTNLDQPDTTL